MAFKIIRIASVLAILSLGVFVPYSANAQGGYRANIGYIENELFPQLEAYVSITDVQGFPVKNLRRSDFAISEDDRSVPDFEVSPVQNTTQPLAVALVIDTSGSMGTRPTPTPLMNAINAAKTFVDSLSSQDLVAVVRFSDAPAVVQDFTADKTFIKSSLDSLTAGGETVMYDGIVKAVGLLKTRNERRILVLITDGRDTGDGQFNYKESMDEAGRWSVPIYPIGFGQVDRQELEQMATLTGGIAQIKPNATDLRSAFDVVLQVLREQYLIRYSSSIPVDGLEHTLLVAVNTQTIHVDASRKFIALPGEITVTLPFQDRQIVGGNILLKPEVLSPAPLARMEIQLDGNLLQIILVEPFEYAWNSTTITPGAHEFNFIITDKVGNTGSASVLLNVHPPVSVTIVNPVQEQSLSGVIKVVADVTSLAGIAKVEFSLDGTVFQTIALPPFEASLDFSRVSAGPHVVSVKAVDVNGFEGSAKTNVTAQGTAWGLLFLVAAIALAFVFIPIGLRWRNKNVGLVAMARTAILREVEGVSPGHIWQLGSQEVRLGRKRDENDVPLAGLSASRHHARICLEDGQHVIYSLSQDNPVLVNNVPVAQKYTLRSGDIIRTGETILRYE